MASPSLLSYDSPPDSPELHSPTPSPPLPPKAPIWPQPTLPPIAVYKLHDDLYESIQAYAKSHGYAFVKSTKKRTTTELKIQYDCDQATKTRNTEKPTTTRKTFTVKSGCKFSVIARSSDNQKTWHLEHRADA